jgi:hypothetical protein
MSETKLNAAQRLILLEQENDAFKTQIESLNQKIFIIADANDKLTDFVNKLVSRFNAVVKLCEQGKAVSNENLDLIMQALEEVKMEKEVAGLVEQGALVASKAIDDRSFIVCRQLDAEGNVMNGRIQLTSTTLNDENKALFIGKVKGDIVKTSEETNSIEIVEIYQIVDVNKKYEDTEAEPEAAPQA